MRTKAFWAAGLFVAGALLFAGALKAQTVADVLHNPGSYIGSSTSVTGIVSSVKVVTRKRHGELVQLLKFNLYEADAKGKKGPHYVYVSVPANTFSTVPAEGQMLTVTATLKPPYEVAVVDE